MSKKIPADEVIKEIYEKNQSVDIIGEYLSKGAPLRVRCKNCGFEWDSTANRLLFGCGCRKCSGAKKRVPRNYYKKTHSQFINELAYVMPTVQIISEYVNAKTKVDCLCTECGHEWSAKPSNLLTGYGCPECARRSIKEKQLKSHDQFVSELLAINPNISVIGKYSGNHCNIELLCMNCGETWFATPANTIRGDGKATGCPHCRESHGECAIKKLLDKENISYTEWKTFDGLVGIGGRKLSYDFYIPSLNLLIEYQGEFHDNTARIQTSEGFQIQREHDKRKRSYAKDHNIRLLEIWYYDNIEEKLTEELYNITDPVTTTAS